MPGGKLAVVDLAIEHGRVVRAQVSGDFFLEPDTALEAINALLTGVPADADADALASAIVDGLPDGVQMYGVSPEAIATAVRRAIDGGETP